MFFEVDYFVSDKGEEYVKTYLDNLKRVSKKLWEKTIAYLRIVNDSQNHGGSFWKPIGEGVVEIRTKFGSLRSRIYCCFSGKQKITLLNGALKSNKKNQQKDISKARELKILLEIRRKNEKNKSR